MPFITYSPNGMVLKNEPLMTLIIIQTSSVQSDRLQIMNASSALVAFTMLF